MSILAIWHFKALTNGRIVPQVQFYSLGEIQDLCDRAGWHHVYSTYSRGAAPLPFWHAWTQARTFAFFPRHYICRNLGSQKSDRIWSLITKSDMGIKGLDRKARLTKGIRFAVCVKIANYVIIELCTSLLRSRLQRVAVRFNLLRTYRIAIITTIQ